MPVLALSGQELLEHIIARMRKELSLNPDFAVHLCHPRVKWSVVIDLSELTSLPPERSHTVSGDTAGEGAPPMKETPLEKIRSRKIKIGSDLITRPGQAREEAGLPQPDRQTLKSGDIVDYAPGEAPWEQTRK